jgi:hypothetical protein
MGAEHDRDLNKYSLAAPCPPNSGLPEFGTLSWPKSDKSDFGCAERKQWWRDRVRTARAPMNRIEAQLLTAHLCAPYSRINFAGTRFSMSI